MKRTRIDTTTVALWASAFVIAALVIVQAGRLPGNPAYGDMAVSANDYTLLTTSSGRGKDAAPNELLYVLDSRGEMLLAYEVEDAQKPQITVRGGANLPVLFNMARRGYRSAARASMSEITIATNPTDAAAAGTVEWLLTGGTGAFAMGTALGANTRRYHGLLVAAVAPPVGRVLALHSVIDAVIIGDRRVELAVQHFDEGCLLHPDGRRHLVAFGVRCPQAAAWRYRVDDIRITRTVRLEVAAGAVTIGYQVEGTRAPVRLEVRPLTPLRDFHGIVGAPHDPPAVHRAERSAVRIERGGIGLRLEQDGASWKTDEQWWRDLAYAGDRERGQAWIEHVWSPGVFTTEMDGPGTTSLHVRLDPMPAVTAPAEAHDPAPGSPVFGMASSRGEQLRAAARQFLVARPEGADGGISIIAGYPWFTDWGRDTMISLPGLLLVPGHNEAARRVLETFARHLQRGLLPNAFDDDGGGASYHTADASLWFVHAVHAYVRRCPGAELDMLRDACRRVVDAYRDGTDFGIGLDPADGLMRIGDGERCLTWMDAARGGLRFTPRDGKPVEINALWFNALCSLAELTEDAAEAARLRDMAEQASSSIRERFWWAERSCLYDVVDAPGVDAVEELRPNQVFAASLPFSPIAPEQRSGVVRAVRDHLLTPFGLRTLAPGDPGYCGRYEGDLMQRDSAYHNGTVWPWLIGPYATAVLRVGGFDARSRAEARSVIAPLLDTLDSGCLHQVAEVYDGDPPHRPSGCPAQAWSVAELQRVLEILDRSAES